MTVVETFRTHEIVKSIATETQKQRIRKYENLDPSKQHSRYQDVRESEKITPEDIRLMDATIILMGILKLPKLDMYWSTRRCISTGYIGSFISRDRFYKIFHNLHFTSKTSDESDGDKLYQIRDHMEALKRLFAINYTPKQNISIDESLDLWKGNRVGFKVFIPRKKAKNGFQSYRLCEADTGYCVDFEYYGNLKEEVYHPDSLVDTDISDLTQPAKTVIHLIKPLLNQGYTLGLDNLYSDPRLFKLLLEHGTNVVGTFRSNRKYLPKGASGKKLKLGDHVAWFVPITDEKRGIMCLVWKDKKAVRMLSTFHDNRFEKVKDKSAWRNPEATKSKPVVCTEYKEIMPGNYHYFY